MTRALRSAFLVIAALSSASAVVFALLHWWPNPSAEFSVYSHPAQPWALNAHLVSSVALTLVLGFLFGVHVLPRWKVEPRARRSGAVLLILAGLMLASGALLPCCAKENLRTLVGWTHGLSGTSFVLAIPWHMLLAQRSKTRVSAQIPGRVAVKAAADSGAPRLRARAVRLQRASHERDADFR